MKNVLLSTFLCCICYNLIAQRVAIQNLKANEIYLCEYNELKIAAEGYKTAELIVTTNNGIVNHEGEGIYFAYFPKRTGRATIYVSVKAKNNQMILLDSVNYLVKRQEAFAEPNSIWYFRGNIISQQELFNASGLSIKTVRPHCNPIYGVLSYTLTIKRKTKILFREMVYGYQISAAANDFFYNLKKNDTVSFDGICYEDCDQSLRRLPPLRYTVREAYKYKKIKPYSDTIRVTDPITGSEVMKIETVTRKKVK